MRPKERRETGQSDLLRSRLDSIIDMDHALVKLARTVDWGFLEERFGAVYSDKPGQPAHSGDDGRSFHAMAGKDSAAWWAD